MTEQPEHGETPPTFAKDVVCGMELPIRAKMLKSSYKDKTYYFCSLHHKQQFDNSPERYT